MGDDLVLDLIIGGLGNNLLGDKIALGVVRTAIDDLLAVSVADPGKGRQVLLAGGVDIDQIRLLGLLVRGIRSRGRLLGFCVRAAAGCLGQADGREHRERQQHSENANVSTQH